jgi:hypothetical protein
LNSIACTVTSWSSESNHPGIARRAKSAVGFLRPD